VLRKLSGLERGEVNAEGEHCVARSFTLWVVEEMALA